MASLSEVKELLQRTTISATTKLDDRFIVEFQRSKFYIPETDIDDYLKIQGLITLDPETAIFYPGNYEHLIESQGPIPGFRRSLRNEDESMKLSSQDETLSLEVSRVSVYYLLKIFQGVDFRIIRRRLFIGLMDRSRSQESPLHITEAFRRFLTIKIRATQDSPHFARRGKLRQIAEAALFHLSYGTGSALNLSRSWERSYNRLSQRRGESVQFPRRTYNSDLVSYYQLALSSDSLILGYLALYKILEHFYLSAAENALHKRLVEKLVQPEFSHTKVSQLRQLTSLIRKYDQRMDELRMLSTVIEQYFTPDEITNWVQDYESASGTYYTIPQTIFGQSHTLDLNPDNLAPSMARRIYHIRNALVHSKEGELPRFIPFSGQETVLQSEIPVILFLAEQLILKTGEDI